ncbi:Protein FRPR-18 b [Aphelenchoides avenae]|nr:Protein FRPR-18 b [Aphelenchus avenae]
MEDDSQQYLACATLAIIILGCAGNILSLYMFLRHSSSVNTLLAALSFVDLCLLLFAVPVFVLPSLDIWANHEQLLRFLAYVLKFVYPINLMMQTCSIYIMVLITMERWTAVSRPLQVRIWCTPRTSRFALLAVLCFAIAYNIIRFWEYSIVDLPDGSVAYERNLRDIEKHPNYVVGYYTVLYLLTHFLLPFGLIIVMNGHVCKSIIQLRRARLMLTRQQQREHNTTMMLLVVTLIFASCNVLPFLLNLAECFQPDLFVADHTKWIAYQLNDLSNLLVVLNSSTTWIIYLTFSAKYRHTALRMTLRCCMPYEPDLKYNSLSRTHSCRTSPTSVQRKAHSTTSAVFLEKCDTEIRCSSSQELFLRPLYMARRMDRPVSEYNGRIKRHRVTDPPLPATKSTLCDREDVGSDIESTVPLRKNNVLAVPGSPHSPRKFSDGLLTVPSF